MNEKAELLDQLAGITSDLDQAQAALDVIRKSPSGFESNLRSMQADIDRRRNLVKRMTAFLKTVE